jgi:hypothetical protein
MTLYRLLAEIAIAAAVCVGLFAAGHHGGYVSGTAHVQSAWDAETKVRNETAIKKLEANRIAGDENDETQQKALDEANRLLTHVTALAPTAAAAGNGLRIRTITVAAACDRGAGSEAATPASAPASSPGDLLAYVQRRMDEAAVGVVEFADAASIAGELCWADGNANRAAALKAKH